MNPPGPPRPRHLALGLALAITVAVTPPAAAQRIPLNVPFTARGYRQIAAQNGTVVYQHRTAEIIRIGAEGRFACPPEVVAAAILDYPRQVKAIARLSEVQILARGPRALRVYQRLNLPVVDDRDFTLQVSWGHDGEVRWIAYHALPADTVPRRRGVVRVTLHEGSWQLQAIDGGRATFVRFTTAIDMGGMIPKWLARSGSGKELPKLFASINELLQSHPRRVAWSSSTK